MTPVPLEKLQRHVNARATPPRRQSQSERLLTFLRQHRREAWTAPEMAAEMGLDPFNVASALRRMHYQGLVGEMGEHWYALEPHDARNGASAKARAKPRARAKPPRCAKTRPRAKASRARRR